ncbi:MAG: hypothetical protein MZV63_57700 [Marinilabiliales bacterium]|nr:hypothetical protein [Marinilabiliales bacterium]
MMSSCIEKIHAIRHLQETEILSSLGDQEHTEENGSGHSSLDEAEAIEDAVFGAQAEAPDKVDGQAAVS